MVLRWRMSVRVAMTGPRCRGSLCPHTMGLGRAPNVLGCDVKTMCFWPFFLSGVTVSSLRIGHTKARLSVGIVYAWRSPPASFRTHEDVIARRISQRNGGGERGWWRIHHAPMLNEVLQQGVLLRTEAPQIPPLIEQRKPDRPVGAGEHDPCEGGHVSQRAGFHHRVARQVPSPDGAAINASYGEDISHRQLRRRHQTMDRGKEGTDRPGRQLIRWPESRAINQM